MWLHPVTSDYWQLEIYDLVASMVYVMRLASILVSREHIRQHYLDACERLTTFRL